MQSCFLLKFVAFNKSCLHLFKFDSELLLSFLLVLFLLL